VNRDIDLDLAITLAEILNLYSNALKRCAGRSTLGPDDTIKILHITNQIMDACEAKGDVDIATALATYSRSRPDDPDAA
jgi:hypothetical protein